MLLVDSPIGIAWEQGMIWTIGIFLYIVFVGLVLTFLAGASNRDR